MIHVNRRIRSLVPSGTVAMASKVRDMISAGVDIIDLTAGEPDYDTPDHILDEAFRAASSGQTRYTSVAGTLQLREAIADQYKHKHELAYNPLNIIVGTGGKQMIFNAMMASLEPGDEVIIPAPYWPSFPDIVTFAGGKPVIVNSSIKSDYKITPTKLHSVISSSTRWLFINSPNNPTGAVYSRNELLEIARVLQMYPDVSVLCDDIYESILFDGHTFSNLAMVALELMDRILLVGGVSKSDAMTGWRIGYAAGPEDFISRMTILQGQSTTCASSISQAAALAALTGRRDHIRSWNSAYQARRDMVFEKLHDVPGLTLYKPEGAFYHYIDCTGLLGSRMPDGGILDNDVQLSTYLLEMAYVGVVPGSVFGGEGCIRLCFACSEEKLDQACRRITHSLDKLI